VNEGTDPASGGESAAPIARAPSSRRFSFPRVLIALAIVLAIFLAVFIAFDGRGFVESRTFYLPTHTRFATPRGAIDVSIPTPDGLHLHGWLFMPSNWKVGDPPVPAVLHVHGNGGAIGYHAKYSSWLASEGFAVLLFDYRGYGTSDEPRHILSRDALFVDTRSAFDFLAARDVIDADRLAVAGQSLGGAFALALASSDQRVKAIVTLAAFAGWREIAREHAGLLGFLAIKPGLDGVDLVKGLGTKPLLIVHGTRDSIVPIAQARELLASATASAARAQLIEVRGAGHNDLLIDDPQTRTRIASFLRSALRAP
jgi:dipeptidyl aminopeptidase/acylaminoacyl peptidase